MGFRAPLTLAPDPVPPREHRSAAAGFVEAARALLIQAARECEKAGDDLAVHKIRSALVNADEAQDRLCDPDGAA